MPSRVLGNLLYYIRGNNSDFKAKALDTGKTIVDLDKKFEDSKKTVQSWSKTFKAEVNQAVNFIKQNREAFQTLAITSGVVLGGIIAELKKATKENNAYKNSLLGLQSVAEGTGESLDRTTQAAKDLTKDGLMGVGDAATGLKNLLMAGFNLDQSIVLMNRFKDSAAFGRQGALSFGEAIRGATEGIKNGNSMMVDNAGVTKNLSLMLTDAGFSASDLVKASSDLNIRMAIYNGIVKETRYQVGDAAKLSDNFSGALSRAGESVNRLHRAIGEANEKTLKFWVDKLNGIVSKTSEWIENNKELAGTLTMVLGGTAAAILAVTTFALALGKIVSTLKMVKTFVLGTDIVTFLMGAAKGAWSWSVAMKAVSTSFTPFLIGGIVIAGLYLIIQCFKEIQKEAKLAAIDIKSTSDIITLKAAKDMWQSKLNAVREQRKADQEILSLPSTAFKDYGMTQKLMEAKARNTPEALEKYRLQVLEYGTNIQAINDQMNKLTSPDTGSKNIGTSGGGSGWSASDTLTELKKNLSDAEKTAKEFGDSSKLASDKATLFKEASIELIKHGINPHKTSLGDLIQQYDQWSKEAKNADDATEKLKNQQENQKTAVKALADGYNHLWGMMGLTRPEWEEFALSLEASAKADGVIPKTAEELRKLADNIRLIGAANDASNKQDRKMDYQYSIGDVSVQNYRDYLAQKLSMYEDYSDEWINISRQIAELDKQLNTGIDWKQLNTDINETMRDGLVNGLMDAINQAKTLQDVFKDLLKQIGQMVLKKALIEPLVNSMFPKMHSGGMIYAHTGLLVPGLKSDEVPIIAQSGERVLSRGQNKAYENILKSGMNTTINMVNQTSQPAQVVSSSGDFDGEKFVVNAIIKDYTAGGMTKNLFGGRR